MKLSKIMGIALAAALAIPAFAGVNEPTFTLQTDLVCNFKHEANGTAFDKIAGVGFPAGRIIPKVSYTIPTPLGENWLVSGANVELYGLAEVSPVTVKPGVGINFTPVPFLVFGAGGDIGAGWNLMGMTGCGTYNAATDSYNSSMFYKGWAQGVFQFDTGALVPGDWTHVLMQYTYQFYYQSTLGASATNPFMWQATQYVAAPREYQCGILAYQLPFAVYRVGVMYESDGYYGYAKDRSITPIACVRFSEKDNLNCALYFKHEAGSTSWYMQRLALSYTHTF